MAGPDDRGGFQVSLPDEDAVRDTIALVRAILWDDAEGQEAILANADLRHLAAVLATALAACYIASVRHALDPTPPPPPLTEQQRHAALAILIAGVTGPDDDNSTGRT
jgi:hypothetical protein